MLIPIGSRGCRFRGFLTVLSLFLYSTDFTHRCDREPSFIDSSASFPAGIEPNAQLSVQTYPNRVLPVLENHLVLMLFSPTLPYWFRNVQSDCVVERLNALSEGHVPTGDLVLKLDQGKKLWFLAIPLKYPLVG